MLPERKRFFRSTTFLRILIISGIILLLASCILIYLVLYGDNRLEETGPGFEKIDTDKGVGKKPVIENYHEKWKGDAKIINFGKPQRRMLYFGTHDLEKEDKTVERVVFTIHGLGRNAAASYEYAKGYYSDTENTAIFAPSYTGKAWQRYKFRKIIKWDNDWPLGVQPKKETRTEIYPKVNLDSFSALDYLTYKAVKTFTNAYEVVFIGFSAGSQFLQRYMASSPYLQELWGRNFHIKGYLTSPGDYMYFNHLRVNNKYKDNCYKVKSIAKCYELSNTMLDFWVVPSDDCNGTYNAYKFGLDKLDHDYPYISRKESIDVILSGSYLSYPVYYIVGGRDKNPPRSKTCAATLQGTTRIQRMFLFLAHIRSLDPNAPHTGVIIPGCQHNEHCIGTNPETKKYFSTHPSSLPDRSGNLDPFTQPKNSITEQNSEENTDIPDNNHDQNTQAEDENTYGNLYVSSEYMDSDLMEIGDINPPSNNPKTKL